MPATRRVQDRRGQAHAGIPPALQIYHSHRRSGVARRRSRRTGAARFLLPDEPCAGKEAPLPDGGVPADLLRRLRVPEGAGAAHGDGRHRRVFAGARHDGLSRHFRPQCLPDQQPAVRGHCCVHRRPLCRRAYGFYPLASVLGFDHRRRRKAHLQSSKRGVPVRPPAPPQSERQAEASGRRILRNAADAHRPQRQKGFRDLQAGQRRPQAVLQDPQQPGLPAVQAHGPRLCHRAGIGSERDTRSHSPRGLRPQPQQQVRRDH